MLEKNLVLEENLMLEENLVLDESLVLEEKLVLEQDMVLEEVEDWEQQQVDQNCLLDTKVDKQAEAPVGVQIHPLLDSHHNITSNVFFTQQEDAETQTERWTPLIENIRREAEEAALASMQER